MSLAHSLRTMALALRSKAAFVTLGSVVVGFGGGRSGFGGWLGWRHWDELSFPVVGDALAFLKGGDNAVRPMIWIKARGLWWDLSTMAVIVVEPPAAIVARPWPAHWSLAEGLMARASRTRDGHGEVMVVGPGRWEYRLGRRRWRWLRWHLLWRWRRWLLE